MLPAFWGESYSNPKPRLTPRAKEQLFIRLFLVEKSQAERGS